MCQFFSALVLKNGDVLHHPMLDSHSDLVTYFKLPDDTSHMSHFAKVELTPVDWMDAATWQFKLDEDTEPLWWDDVAIAAEAACRAIVGKMMIREPQPFLLDGMAIVGPHGSVSVMRGGRLVLIEGGTVEAIRGGTVKVIWGGTVEVIEGGTVKVIWGGTVEVIRGGTVEVIWGGTVEVIEGGTVEAIRGGTVKAIEGGTVLNDSRVRR